MSSTDFTDLNALALSLQHELTHKKCVLLFAYNGTGKTRLSTAFKDIGKKAGKPNTLYFNAFTEDLFSWYNDLDGDTERYLILHSSSNFLAGIEGVDMDSKIHPLLQRYADFDFKLDKVSVKDEQGKIVGYQSIVRFSRKVMINGTSTTIDNIKISRGEEKIFIWSFFLAIVQLALDDAEAYRQVEYIYIDDPVSSLDEHNAIVVANHLVQMFREAKRSIRTVISTHHNLFFNVLHYELKNLFSHQASQYVLSQNRLTSSYVLQHQKGDTPSFHHVAALAELYRVSQGDTIHTYHFNMLRVILEKTALFHGHGHFSACIKQDPGDADGILHQRFVDLLSHGKYSMFEPSEMGNETKEYFRTILHKFRERYPFNPNLFVVEPAETTIP